MDTQPACMQLDRTNKTKSRKVSQICIFIGINNCFAPHFDVNVSSASHEKLIYPVNHKFCPDFISLCFKLNKKIISCEISKFICTAKYTQSFSAVALVVCISPSSFAVGFNSYPPPISPRFVLTIC